MGAAIARALLAGQFRVTVWNRSEPRLRAFADSGAQLADSVQAALDASPVCIICIDDYDATWRLLESVDSKDSFRDKVFVQVSTGTPAEARTGEQWAQERGAFWLDGAILAYPREVGDAALICIAGEEQAYEQCRPLLDELTSDIRYLGDAVGAAAALDVAVLSYYICSHLGLVHGAMICQSEQVPADLLSSIIVESLPGDSEEIAHLGKALATGKFSEPGASLGVYHGVLQRILSQAEAAGINAEIPRFAAGIVERGMAAGFADEEVVSVIKVLKRQNPDNSRSD
jgi:3-hydroxyisobutyrate dehydrogenase-like beta-hydroxyacid dehydrogenase